MLLDLDRLQEIEINNDGRRAITRTPATGNIGPLFRAARIALPAEYYYSRKPMLCSCSKPALALKALYDSRAQVAAFLPSLIHCCVVPLCW